MEELISAEALARRLGILTATLAKWRRSGKGPNLWVYTANNRVVYPESAVEEYVATLLVRELHKR